MRYRIYNYARKYKGDYNKIFTALKTKEAINPYPIDCNFITIIDKEYPAAFRELKKPPFIIFYKGDISLLNYCGIAVVGSRVACDYALEVTKNLIKYKPLDLVISGMAKGIDYCAHSTALKNNIKTIAVLGSGINYIYPYQNRALYHEISQKGLIISEFPNFTKPKPHYFPFRNRLIAALASEVYVMQAGIRSGTMTTVNEALDLNRPVYVLPYRLSDEEGVGSNRLIQEGAELIEISDIR